MAQKMGQKKLFSGSLWFLKQSAEIFLWKCALKFLNLHKLAIFIVIAHVIHDHVGDFFKFFVVFQL